MTAIDAFQTRRAFIGAGCSAAASLLVGRAVASAPPAGGRLFSAMGISGGLDRAAFLKQQGAEFLTVGTGELLVPDQPEEAFARQLAKAREAPLPVLACNGFIRPADLRCVGPQANHDAILAWADTAFKRLKRVRGKFIVFGSGGARRIPDGWPRGKAADQFVSLLKRMGPLAEAQGVTVAVEQLQASECNFINCIGDAARLIRRAGHPHVRVLADLFHMARMGDMPADLKAAMDVVVQIEIAEVADRTYPGVSGDDFRPFFRVLKSAGYSGAISIEGKGADDQLAAAFHAIASQAASL